ncbi:MAG: oxygen-independent coproporphyrinogen III oxidase [Actinomycetota bacterium]|nr:oxygen-independent coproporphyrinogen III oxidase [Actinomycetota bacterium]MDK1025872.1 oxygen-independent coproporphyrinogen III oxidase [Actinomycetota bacterium]MDK1038998.1 oxygen-independent coproporphyrinogen III oxidase [Actinomycetota bacterium]MDK1096941.1 oxygen-independent coproporphyrinogen III oxidase [Actinomycetota bacterium]MDK1291763.1 oxygen-independent coproporphyrinogen III oxidase [Actinomycetota bacterium]
MTKLSPELLERYDQPGPRYTSYPTAIEFADDFQADAYAKRLASYEADPDAPLSLYVHLPFCESRCSFCACHVVVSKNESVADAYLARVEREAQIVAEHLGEGRPLLQYHWGGGTPTYYPPSTLVRLHRSLTRWFDIQPDAEVAAEVDPRVTTRAHLETMWDLGFNRLSFGVQDLDPNVQELIGRGQTESETVELYDAARDIGYRSINLDLIYGLPGQTEDTMAATLDTVTSLRPDRLAIYSFAYVPWMRPHQRRIPADSLPEREEKFQLLSMIAETLTSAGYRAIGMDHFALPEDDLSRAADAGTLTRNFMGYSTQSGAGVVALGTSGISDISGAYAQNHRRLASYYSSVDQGVLPIERGYSLTADDRVRRHIITELMCNGEIRFTDIKERFGIDFATDFARERKTLTAPGGLADEGMVDVREDAIVATDLGRMFIRNVARVFDAHTGERAQKPMFSKSI